VRGGLDAGGNGATLIAEPNLIVALENVDDLVLTRVDVTRWTPTGRRNLLENGESAFRAVAIKRIVVPNMVKLCPSPESQSGAASEISCCSREMDRPKG
jgi:hypothetical protein